MSLRPDRAGPGSLAGFGHELLLPLERGGFLLSEIGLMNQGAHEHILRSLYSVKRP